RRTGLDRTPDGRAAVGANRQQVLAALYVEDSASRFPKQPDSELRELFHRGEDTARLVLVAVATQDEARAVRARVDAGGDLAAEAGRSLDPTSAAKKGDTGVVPRITLDPALAALVFSARKGAIVGPVQLRNGWAVAKVLETSVGSEEAFKAARPRLEAFSQQQLLGQARAHALEMLRKKAKIDVDEKALASLGDRVEPSTDEAGRIVLKVDGRAFAYRDVLSTVRTTVSLAHGSARVKTQAVSTFADEHLLATAAVERGLDRKPENVTLLVRNEVHSLAQFMGRKVLAEIAARTPPDKAGAAFEKRADELVKANQVWVDRATALAAVR
ncbi:MAG TPA: peptidylprolyl isomerase, partial [Anaeromyxobacteraceae bacterium]|nr:peptidylprolyl isomerase [Anaeromyxobacteraceae bacterium]